MKMIKKILAGIILSSLLLISIGTNIGEIKEVYAAENTYTGVIKTSSKKGIQLSEPTNCKDLGISEAFMNIPLNGYFTTNTTSKYNITYAGKTYYFDETAVNNYDSIIGSLTSDGINFTVAFLLNDFNTSFPDLYYPGVTKRSGTHGYGINTSTEAGKNMVEAAMHFVAARYNGGSNGLVSNYIVGNEINYAVQYAYVGEREIDSFVDIYYNSFKTITNAIKAENPSAKTYVCVAPRWVQPNRTDVYSGRDLLLKFAAKAKTDNLDWNLAFHAYSYPLSRQNVLRDGEITLNTNGKSTVGNEITNSEDTMLISMKNINILTDFMQKPEMLDSNGNVRSIILSEQGYTSASNVFGGTNETLQAANIAFAYYVAEMNPYIDAFILNGQTADGEPYKFGILNSDETPKKAWNMYKYIDTDKSLEVTEFAKATLGIDDWAKAIRNWDASKFSSMKMISNENLMSVVNAASATGGSVLNNGMGPVADVYWNGVIYTHGYSSMDHAGVTYPNGVSVMNGYASPNCYQILKHTFSPALDCTSTPYLGIGFKMIGNLGNAKYSTTQNEEFRVRVYSGDKVYDANAKVTTGTDNYLFVDLSEWSGKTAIDKVEIWTRELGTGTNFDGVIVPYEFMTASALTGATAAAKAVDTSLIKLTADPTYALTTPYDYSKDVPPKKEPVIDPGSTPFTDLVAGSWYLNAVNYVYTNNIMSGVSATKFGTDTLCTRGMMVTILYSVTGKPVPGPNSPFLDLKAEWYKAPVTWAYNNKVCSGKSATTFEPDVNVTRQEMAVFLMSYANFRGFDTSARADISKYTDEPQVAAWAKEQIKWANASGVISGKTTTTLVPTGNANRAEVAQMIMSFQKKFGK